MFQSLLSLGPWLWLIVGVFLAVMEAIIPGVFLAWFGIAAFITGLIAFVVEMSWPQEALVFAITSGLSVFIARFFTSDSLSADEQPDLNRREQQMIGRMFTLEEDMVHGRGKVRVGDSMWQVEGPDVPAGSVVEVTGLRGNTLLVSAAKQETTS